jgi:hypothetical protein
MRAEWSAKRGWYKFGSRHRIFDKSDNHFGHTIKLFKEKYGDSLSKILKEVYKVDGGIAYYEYFGPNSFAGKHLQSDIDNGLMELVLFDINIKKKGFVGPTEFLDIFKSVPKAHLVYEGLINQVFIEEVKRGKHLSDEAEGVVVKWGEGHKLEMGKIKTNAWLAKVKNVYGEHWRKYA